MRVHRCSWFIAVALLIAPTACNRSSGSTTSTSPDQPAADTTASDVTAGVAGQGGLNTGAMGGGTEMAGGSVMSGYTERPDDTPMQVGRDAGIPDAAPRDAGSPRDAAIGGIDGGVGGDVTDAGTPR